MTSNRHRSIVAGVLCGTLVLTIAPARAQYDTTTQSTTADSGDASEGKQLQGGAATSTGR